MTDDAAGGSNAYTGVADARSVATGCQGTEIWFARATRPATKFTVTLDKGSHAQAWIVEVSGLRESGAADMGVASCQTTGDAAAQNPFVSLGPQEGNIAGYFIATTLGTRTATPFPARGASTPLGDGVDLPGRCW